MLVAHGDIEDRTSAGDVQPFVAVTDEEVGIQLGEIERDVADSMCAVDEGEDIVLFAQLSEALKGHAYAG